jgi:serine/threonine protein phosphatase PrpC
MAKMQQWLFADTAGAVELLDVGSGQVAVYCTPAPGRESPNEDAAAVVADHAGNTLLMVADGVGGAAFGAEAARSALETIGATFAERPGADELRSVVLDGIERANDAVRGIGGGAACTLAVVQIAGRDVRPYHVGDAMSLVVGQRGRLKHETIPHGHTGYGLAAGLLDEHEALTHEERHVVSNVVGATEMQITVGPQLRVARRDTIVLASDGLFDNLFLQEVIDAIRIGPLEQAARRLADQTRRRMTDPEEGQPSKADDLGFILYRPNGRD